MPDVPERCPECGSDLSQKFDRGYHLAWYKCKSVLFCTGGFRQSLACLQNQRDNLRSEAERWKRRHNALQEAVFKADALIVDAINHANAMYNYTQDAYYESYSDGLDEALTILRQLLDEAEVATSEPPRHSRPNTGWENGGPHPTYLAGADLSRR